MALLSGAVLGLSLWRTRYEEREAKAGRPKGPQYDVVEIEFYPDDVVVKVYIVHGAYEAQVWWRAVYQGDAGGFDNVKMALAWGRAFARNKGAAT